MIPSSYGSNSQTSSFDGIFLSFIMGVWTEKLLLIDGLLLPLRA